MKKSRKVFLAVGLASSLVFCLTLTGCGETADTVSTNATVSESEVVVSGNTVSKLEVPYIAEILDGGSLLSLDDLKTSIGSLDVGSRVKVTGQVSSNGVEIEMYEVSTEDERTGIVDGQFLNNNVDYDVSDIAENVGDGDATNSESDFNVSAIEPKTMYTTQSANVRLQPNTSSEIYTNFAEGFGVTVVGTTDDGWFQVEYDSLLCYIHSSVLSDSAPVVEGVVTTEQTAQEVTTTSPSTVTQPVTTNTEPVQETTQTSTPTASEIESLEQISSMMQPREGEVTIGGTSDGFEAVPDEAIGVNLQ